MTNELLMAKLKNEGVNCKTSSADNALIDYCLELAKDNQKIVFIFMASSGMEGRIKLLVNGLSK